MPTQSKADIYYRDIIALCKRNAKAVHYNYIAWLSIATRMGVLCKAVRVLAIDITKDYISGFTDHAVVELRVKKRDYIEKIYPNRNNLEVYVEGKQIFEREGTGVYLSCPSSDQPVYGGRAFLVDPVDIGVNSRDGVHTTENSDLNKDFAYFDIKLQCMASHPYGCISASVGGVYDEVPWRLLRHLMTAACKLSPQGGVGGVDIYKPDVQQDALDIIIPHGTRFLELPKYIQENWGGIYTTGIGCYFADIWPIGPLWYVYPLYRFKRYSEDKYKLTLSVIPKARMYDNKRTYYINGNHVHAIVSGDINVSDNAEARIAYEGNGITFYDPNKLKQAAVKKIHGKGVYVDGQVARKQVFHHARQDDHNFAPYTRDLDKFQMTLEKITMRVAEKHAMVVSLIWEHSKHNLLIPGVGVKVIYYKNDQRREFLGVLAQQVSYIAPIGGTMQQERYECHTGLVVILDKNSYV